MAISELLLELFEDLVINGNITSADDWYKSIRESGISVTRQEVRSAWKEINEPTGYSRIIANLPDYQRPYAPWAVTTEESNFDKFTVKFRATYIDVETGYEIKSSFYITDKKLLTRGEYQQRILEEMERYAQKYGYQIVSFEWRGFYRRV